MEPDYRQLVAHYEACLQRHGDNHRGVDWPKVEDVATRYDVMLSVIREAPGKAVSLLDFGCGGAHLYDHLQARGRDRVRYVGADLSPRFIELCRSKYPHLEFHCGDVLDEAFVLPEVDYVVANGVFTEKLGMSFDVMFDFFQRVVVRLFAKARIGLAFNTMSAHVDWQRDDLFHLPLDRLAAFLRADVSRHFQIRHDYGLYEYTTYVYRPASQG